MAVMAARSMKAKKVMKAKTVVKVPNTKKAKSLKTLNATIKAKEVFRVVNFLHLGLGLKLGNSYTKSHMQKLCAGDRSKLKRLATYMEDPTRLQPEWLAAKSARENVNVKKSAGNKSSSKKEGAVSKMASSKTAQKSTYGTHQAKKKLGSRTVSKPTKISKPVSKKQVGSGKTASKFFQKSTSAAQKENKHKKAKRVITKVTGTKLFSKAKSEVLAGAPIKQSPKTCGKTSPKANAIELQKATKTSIVKPRHENIVADQRKNKLIGLPLEDLQELHKTNDLRTEPVKDFFSRVKTRFMSKKLSALQELCKKKKLPTSGTKGALATRLLGPEKEILKTKMVEALLIFEADARKQEREHNAKARAEAIKHKEKMYSAMVKLRKQMAAKTGDALTAHLRDYGLKVSGSKSEKIERVVAALREHGEAEKIIAARASRARKQKLRSMNAASLILECAKNEKILEDSQVKQVIVDRLVLNEEERMASQK